MRCRRIQERLILFLAGELSESEAAGIARHLETCPECSRARSEIEEMEAKIAAAWQTDAEPSLSFDSRVMESIRVLPQSPRNRRPIFAWAGAPKYAFGSAGLLLMLFGFGAGRITAAHNGNASTMDMAQFRAAHLKEVQADTPVEVSANVPQEVSRKLTEKLTFPVKAVDLGPEGAQLIGGGRSVVQEAPVAVLRYSWHGKPVSMFQMDSRKLSTPVMPRTTADLESYFAGRKDGVCYVAWRSGKTNCVLVSQAVPMHLLFQLACHACEKQDAL